MNYIGSKHKLSSFISDTIHHVCGEDLSQKVFGDLFAGTGIVGRIFKDKTKQVIANDLEYYSYILNTNYLLPYKGSSKLYFDTLNSLLGLKGFIYDQYAAGGGGGRLYFNTANGQKIDAIRSQIEQWKNTAEISENLYFHLLASLLEAADKVANTASVYGAYLKKIKPSAQKSLVLYPLIDPTDLFNQSNPDQKNEVYQEDSNVLIKKIAGDILYLDPPYNARQYGANYHLLNTIAKYDTFAPRGKTGLRSYNKSAYSSKIAVAEAFEELIKNAQFSNVFVSYNNEGLMSPETVRTIMSKYGKYDLATTNYQRFKADKTNNRHHKATHTTEYLHILEK